MGKKMKWIKEEKQTILLFLKTGPESVKTVLNTVKKHVDSVNVFEEVEERHNINEWMNQ